MSTLRSVELTCGADFNLNLNRIAYLAVEHIPLNIYIPLDIKYGDTNVTCSALPNYKGLQMSKEGGLERTSWTFVLQRQKQNLIP